MARIVIVLCAVFGFSLVAHHVHAAEITFAVDGELTSQKETEITISLDTQGEFINAIEAYIIFDPAHVEVTSIDTHDSLVDLWVSEPRVENDGRIVFIGGMTSGTLTMGAPLAKFQIRPKGSTGDFITLALDEKKSGVHKSDGMGTRLSLSGVTGIFPIIDSSIAKPTDIVIRSSSHPSPDSWYAKPQATISWETTYPGPFSYTFTQDPQSEPDHTPESSEFLAYVDIPEDGIWYFAITAKSHDDTWSEVVRRVVRSDTTPPLPFAVTVYKKSNLFNGKSVAIFAAEDAMSGVAVYRVEEDDIQHEPAVSPYILQNKYVRKIRVTAYDHAGNAQETTYALSYKKEYTIATIILLVVVLLFVWQRILARRRDQQNMLHL